MQEILQREFFDNSVEAYLTVICIFFFAVILKRLISKFLAGLIFKIFKAGKSTHKESFINLVVAPLEIFLIVLIIILSLDKLNYPGILEFNILHHISFHDFLESIGNAALIITFIRLCIRIIRYIALVLSDKATDQSGNQLIPFFNDFFRVVLIVIGGLLILHFSFDYKVGNLLTGLSLIGAAIALATKESLENLIASFIIFFDKPFFVGDTVKVQGFTGAIEKIGLRSTRIRTDQKTFITVPNKQMVDTIIDNVSMRTQRRATLSIEVGLSATADQLKNIIEEIKKILVNDALESSTVFFSETGKNAHIISIEYFATMQQTLAEFRDLRQQINLQIIDLFNKNKVEFAAASADINVTQK